MTPLLVLYLRSRRRTTTRPSGVVGTHVAATIVGHPGMRVGHSALRTGGDPRHPSRPSSRCAGSSLPSRIPSVRCNSRQPGGAGRGWPRASVAMTTERAAPWEVTETVDAPVFPAFLPLFFSSGVRPCTSRCLYLLRAARAGGAKGEFVLLPRPRRRVVILCSSYQGIRRVDPVADGRRCRSHRRGWRRRKQLVWILLERVVAPVIWTWVSSLGGLEE